MRKVWLGIAGVVVLAGAAAGYGVFIHPDRMLRAALDDAIKLLPPGYSASYAGARYSLLGRRAVLTGVTIRGNSPWWSELAVAEVEVVRPNLDFAAAWARAAAAPSALAADAVIPLADTIITKGSRLTGERGSSATALARVDGARVFPAAILGRELPSWREALAPLDRPPEQLSVADLTPLLRLAAAWSLAVASDGQTAEDVTARVVLPNNPTYPSGEISYALRRSSTGPHAGGKFSAMTVEGVTSSSDPTMSLTLDAATVADVDVEKPLRRVLAGEPLAPALLDGLAIGKIDYRGLTVRATQGTAPVHLSGFSLADMRFAGEVPVSARLALDAVELTREMMSDVQSKQALALLGLDKITLSFSLAWRWDLPRKALSVSEVALKIDELGTVSAAFDAEDAPPTLAMWDSARLVTARFRYQDGSMVERLFKAFGGANPGAMRAQIAAVAQQQGAAPNATPALQAAASAVALFISSPHALVIDLAPPKPLLMREIGTLAKASASPAELIATLGVRFTAEK